MYKHINEVQPGDVVVDPLDGVPRTVCCCDLKQDEFFGRTLWGDCYRLGTVPVEVVTPPHIRPCLRAEKP